MANQETSTTFNIEVDGIEKSIKQMQDFLTTTNTSSDEVKEMIIILKNLKDTFTSGIISTSDLKASMKEMDKIKKIVNSILTDVESSTKIDLTNLIKDYETKIVGLEKRIAKVQKDYDKAKVTSSKVGRDKLAKDLVEKEAKSSGLDPLINIKVKDPIRALKAKNIQESPEKNTRAQKILEQVNDAREKSLDIISKSTDDLAKLNKELEETNTLLSGTREKLNNLMTPEQKAAFERTKEVMEQTKNATNDAVNTAESNNETTVKVTQAIDQQSISFSRAAKQIIGFRTVMRLAQRVWNEALKTIREMDSAITGMTVVTGKSREETYKYIDTLREISNETSATMTDVANLTTEYLRQGRSMQDALTLAKETAKAAKISNLSTAETIQYMTSAINGFNLEASEASHVSDVFANVAAKTATDYEQLAVALSKVSAQANLAGLSMEYTTALLAKGIETTQEAPESIGTALKTILARMRELTDYGTTLEEGTSVNKVERALAAANIQLRDENGAFRDLTEIFNELGPKWESLNTMQQQAIAQAVAGTRQQARFIAIMQDWDRTLEITTEAYSSAGAASYQYSQYQKGLEATMSRLTTAWQGFTQTMVNTEFVIGTFDILGKTLNSINNVLNTGIGEALKTILYMSGAILAISQTQNAIDKVRSIFIARQLATEQQLQGQNLIEYLLKTKTIKQQDKILKQALQRLNIVFTTSAIDETMLSNDYEKYILAGKTNKKEYEDLIIQYQKAGLSEKEIQEAMTIAYLKGKKLRTEQKSYFTLLKEKIVNGWNLTATIAQLLFSKKILNEKQKQLILSTKNVFLANLMQYLEAKRLISMKGETEALTKQLAKSKENLSISLKGKATVLATALTVTAIVAAIKTIYDYYEEINNVSEHIAENNNKIYEATQKKSGLQSLIDEYTTLNKTINKTTEQQERLAEIEKSMADDYGITDKDKLNGAMNQMAKYNKAQRDAYNDNLNLVQKYYNSKGRIENEAARQAMQDKSAYDISEMISSDSSLSNTQKATAMAQTESIIGNIDYEQAAKYGSNYGKENIVHGTAIGAVGGVAAGATVAGLITAGTTLATIPVAGWILGGLTAAAGLVIGIYKGIESRGKESAEYTRDYLLKTENNIADFTTNYAKNIEQLRESNEKLGKGTTLAEEAQLYKQTLESASGYTQSAVDAINKNFSNISILADEKYGSMADTIQKYFKLSNADLKKLITQYSDYGNKTAEAFLEAFGKKLQDKEATGLYDEEELKKLTSQDVYTQAAKGEGEFLKKYQEGRKKELEKSLKDIEDELDGNKKELNKAAKAQGLTLEEYKLSREKEKANLEKRIAESDSDAQKELKDMSLNMVSSIGDKTTLHQTLTRYDSSKSTISNLLKASQEGTLTIEQLSSLSEEINAEDYEALMAALQAGDIGTLTSLITKLNKEQDNNRIKTIQGAINRLEIQNADEITAEETRKANEQTIAYYKTLLKYQQKYTSVQLESMSTVYKEEELKDRISNKELKAYKEMNDLLEEKLELAQKNLLNATKEYSEFDKLVRAMRDGKDIQKDLSNLSEEEQVSFKEYYEATKTFYDEVDEAQKNITNNIKEQREATIELENELIDAFKNKLEKEQDALKESLDKRKEMYEEYFDALDEEAETEDFEAEQKRLQKAIAALSMASDGTSQAKLKEYQQQLSDLEKDQLQNERDARRDAVMTGLDNRGDQIDQYYSTITSNNAEMLLQIQKISGEQLEQMLRDSENFDKATITHQAKIEEDIKNLLHNFGINGYSNGGRVDYTGLAMLHGSSNSPEWVLNSRQVEVLRQLVGAGISNNNSISSSNQSVNIDSLNISLTGAYNSNNMNATGDSLAQAFFDGLKRTGISVNMKR